MTADRGPRAPADEPWPVLDYPAWRETALTLQLWTQIVGKVRLAATPWLNHSWHVALYVTAAGLGTSPIHVGDELLEIEFDFIADRLVVRTGPAAGGRSRSRRSRSAPSTAVLAALADLGVAVAIDPTPNEIADPIPFRDDDVHVAYDPDAARRFWRALVQIDRVFKQFRTGFLGKCSPVHFFWGSFDLAVTRFSGRRAPLHPGGVPHLPDAVAREAYSHEVSSAGFWPGGDAFAHAAFYSYAYPEPPGFARRPVAAGRRVASTRRWASSSCPTTRSAPPPIPDAALLAFLQSTYEAAADAGGWDRAALECPLGAPGRPWPIG